MSRLKVQVDGRTVSVDRDDVASWAGATATEAPASDPIEAMRATAVAYIRAHPRPEPDAQGGVNVPARQRMALLRRLAAGPATRRELLSAMRSAAGYVGGDDWRNRLDELRGHGRRGGGHTPLPLVLDDGHYRLAETFAALSDRDRSLLGEVKRLVAGDPDLGPALAVLDGLLPDVAVAPQPPSGAAPSGSRSTPSSSGLHRSSPRSADRNRS